MNKNAELIARLEHSRAEMLAQLEQIDASRKIYPLWSVREILAHLSGWDEAVITFIRLILNGEEPGLTLAARGIDAYNAASVAARASLEYAPIYREYLETRRTLLDLLRQVPEELLWKEYPLPWGGQGSLVEMINIFAPHESEHAEDVKKLVEAQAGRGPG